MTLVTLDILNAPGVVRVVAFTPTRARDTDEGLEIPEPQSFTVVGDAEVVADIEPSTDEFAYYVSVSGTGKGQYMAVPDVEAVDFSDLEVVDITTLTPVPAGSTTAQLVAAEAVLRQSADDDLQTAIDTKASSSALASEATTRGNADTALSNRVTPLETLTASGRLSETSLNGAYATVPSIAPPADANVKYWLSNALRNVTVDPSPASRFSLFAGQEPSAWWDNNKWNILYTNGNGYVAYRSCTSDPTVAANWSSETVVINLGRFTPHGYLYREGSTLYYYFADHADQGIYVATAPATNPGGTWTVVGEVIQPTVPSGIGGAHTGNMCVVKDGSTYYMFIEQLAQNVLGADGTTNSWQMFVATSSSPTGTFVDTVSTLGPLTTLRPNGMGSVSGPSVAYENGEWIMFYHGGAWARFFPDQGYRAVASNLAADAWTQLDQGRPFARRAASKDYDQVADISFARHPNGEAYLFYAANRNATPSSFNIVVTPLLPALMVRTASGAWMRAAPASNGELAVFNAFTPRVTQSVPYLDPQGTVRGGTWGLDTSPAGMWSNVRRRNSTAALNDYIGFDVLVAPGTYSFALTYGKGPDHAIISLEMSATAPSSFNKTFSTTIDGYAASASVNNQAAITLTVYGTEPIWARIRLKAGSKHASSSGYVISDQGWQLTRTDLT